MRLLTSQRHTHLGWDYTNTLIHTCNPLIPQPLKHKQIYPLIKSPSPCPTSFLFPFFQQPASISTSPVSGMMLSPLMSQELSSFSYPVLSSSLPALQISPRSTSDPKQLALTPEQPKLPSTFLLTMQWLQLRRYYWQRLQWQYSASRESWEKILEREEVKLRKTHWSCPAFIDCLPLNAIFLIWGLLIRCLIN